LKEKGQNVLKMWDQWGGLNEKTDNICTRQKSVRRIYVHSEGKNVRDMFKDIVLRRDVPACSTIHKGWEWWNSCKFQQQWGTGGELISATTEYSCSDEIWACNTYYQTS
jgi:hypothetical protein